MAPAAVKQADADAVGSGKKDNAQQGEHAAEVEPEPKEGGEGGPEQEERGEGDEEVGRILHS